MINAALRELATAGLEALSLRNVAKRAGVSPPAVYRHFHDKDDLLTAVAVECADRLFIALRQAAAAAPPDPLERFRATGIAYLRFAVAHPDYYLAMSVPGLLERAPAAQRASMVDWQSAERAALEQARAEGKLADLPVDDILLTGSATMKGVAHLILEGQLGPVDDARAEQIAIAVTAALGTGFWPRRDQVEDPRTGLKHGGA
ncbi:MAG TPA: TetR/AcrR family transcriptional regulator [Kofleriaceae bacterium]